MIRWSSEARARELGVRLVDLETLFRDSDIVTVNCPLSAETRGLVNADRLAADEEDRLSYQHGAWADCRSGCA